MPDTSPADPHDSPLSSERTDYLAGSLTDETPEDPHVLFAIWLREAFERRESHGDLVEPSAVVLSSVEVTASGPRPRSRTVLLKSHDAAGLVLYTNLLSAKGRQLQAVPWASILLPWYPLQRQVRIDGRTEPVADAEADAYFASRPRGSQIGAWASHQSQPIGGREELDAAYVAVERRFEGLEVTRPPHWGGVRLVPDRFEFWQGRSGRMHDRLAYEASAPHGAAPGWTRSRLQP